MRILLLLLIIIPLVLSAPSLSPDLISEPSEGYRIASERVAKSTNFSVDPCEDFFEFSCGKWIADNPIPPHLTMYSTTHELRETVDREMKELFESREESTSSAINKLHIFFRSCLKEDEINLSGVKEFLKIVEEMRFWPIIHGTSWNPKEFDLTALLIKVTKHKNVNLIVDLNVEPDYKNASKRLLMFDQGSLGLGFGSRDYYMDKKKFFQQLQAYRELMIQRAIHLTKDAGLHVDMVKIVYEVDEVIRFETKLAEITVPQDDKRNYTRMYNPMKFSDFIKLAPAIDWERYLLAISPSEVHDYIKSDPVVIVEEVEFIRKVDELLNSTDPKILTNYVFFRFMNEFKLQLGNKYDDVYQTFSRVMTGQKERAPRWKDCIEQANRAMIHASGAMYVRKHFDAKSKEAIIDLGKELLFEFKSMLKDNDWMDEETKKYAEQKADQMVHLIAYPDFILDDKKLDEWYQDVDIIENDTYSQVQEKSLTFRREYDFKRLLRKEDRLEWEQNPSTVNAYFNKDKNAIIFPAAFLRAPFFHPSFPVALNYGGLGVVFGHEITHGFDDKGRQFDSFGNLRQWWDEKNLEKYTERAKCIVDQYSNVSVPDSGLNINGKITQGENIADNGGVKEAFRAYKRFLAKNGPEKKIPGFEQFSNDQMFFLGYSQTWCYYFTKEAMVKQLLTNPHAPAKYRVNVVLQNQPEFSEAFNCPIDSPMNPQKKCSVW